MDGAHPDRTSTATNATTDAIPARGDDAITDRLPTGVDILDRLLGGGIPPGSLVTLSARPMSQAEMFIYELARARPTRYLTLIRSEAMVSRSLERAGVPEDDITVHSLGRVAGQESRTDSDAVLDRAREAIQDIDEESNVIIDPVDVLERAGTGAYQAFLNDLDDLVFDAGGVAFLHSLDGRTVPDQRDVTEYMADTVFTLSTEIADDRIDTRLAVPKFRGRRALQETIKLDLTEEITVDMSRNIA